MSARLMRFRTAVIREGAMWCVPLGFNWLFKVYLDDWMVEAVCNWEYEDRDWMEFLLQNENSIWGVANQGVRVAKYHISTGESEGFEMAASDRKNLGAIEYREMIWIIPRNLGDSMICFDMNEKVFMVHEEWEQECRKNGMTKMAKSFCFVGHVIYLIMPDRCEVLKYDLESRKLEVERVETQGMPSFQCIFRAQGIFYITSHVERKLIRWNEETGEVKEFSCPCSAEGLYLNGVEYGDGILLLAVKGETDRMIDFFETDTEMISPYDNFGEKIPCDNGKGALFVRMLTYGDSCLLIPWRANMLLEYRRTSGEWRSHSLEMPKDFFGREYIRKMVHRDCMIGEGMITLKDFLQYINTSEGEAALKEERQARIGADIYGRLVRER